MIPKKISRKHLLAAAEIINREGVPKMRQSTRYNVLVNGSKFPPKYIISVAGKLATGKMISSQTFSGGAEANSFLRVRGFSIIDKSGKIITSP